MYLPPSAHVLLTLSLSWLLRNVSGFNLDLSGRLVYHGEDNSDFGYSVALFTNTFRGNKVIVGAPRASTPVLQNFNLSNSGAIYRCNLDNSRCQTISVQDRPNQRTTDSKYFNLPGEDRNNQLFGASVTNNADGSVIAACAPLYVTLGPRGNKREPTGDCYISKDAGGRFIRVSPCLDQFTAFYKKAYRNESTDQGWASYHKTGHGLCGFSLALGPNNELGIGAPGNYYFHGGLYSVAPQNDYRRFASTGDGPKTDDNNYMTWDMKYGEFDGDTSTIDYVTSAPRSDMLKGRVLLWSKVSSTEITSITNITGEQAGGYFGYALAVGNFDGVRDDQFDDIAVSAPLYADYDKDLSEIGRVTIYYQDVSNDDRSFRKSTTLTGEYAYGRFGLALANVGDLNKDGKDDLMVSAPYGGPEHRGVVYLYHGSWDGVSPTPVQVIYSEDVSKVEPPQTFGWSITGNVDIDGNLYNDVAVGAYKSNQAILFKTRPLITLHCNLETANKEIQLPVACSRRNEESNLQFEVKYCIRYEAVGEPEEINLHAFMEFDSKTNKTKRAFGSTSGNSVEDFYIPLRKSGPGGELCSTVAGYIHSNIRDKITPLFISMRFELFNTSSTSALNSPQPIINQIGPAIKPLMIDFVKSCDKCIPDLSVYVTTPTQHYILGTEEKIELQVTVANEGQGEDSYYTRLEVFLPKGVSYVNIIPKKEECLPLACKQDFNDTTSLDYIMCDVGNPFPARMSTTFTLVLRLDDIQKSDASELSFGFLVASSYHPDLAVDDNTYTLNIPLMVKTSLDVNGLSHPDEVITYNNTRIAQQQGPLLEHKYLIYTSGPSLVGPVKVEILWPLYNLDKDDYILYVYKDIEVMQGQAECEPPLRFINPQNVSVSDDSSRTVKRYRRDYSSVDQVTCNNNKTSCVRLYCTLPDLNQETVILKIHSFLWLGSSTNKLTNNYTSELSISSEIRAEVLSVPYTVQPTKLPTSARTVTSYFEQHRPPKEVKPIDWKWVAIGIGCGLLLLIIIITILWLCGFFKRYRPYAEAKVVKQENGQPHEVERLCDNYHQ